ncbi:hypothetical protein RGAI101_3838 [Roseobacter sp. GAI101]|nr:hypothetical protein RGAI101_3838 [Roseobacter sp. GAI101]
MGGSFGVSSGGSSDVGRGVDWVMSRPFRGSPHDYRTARVAELISINDACLSQAETAEG